MELKEAVRAAKAHVVDLFGEEGANGIGLEEVYFDQGQDEWVVTIGFNTPLSNSDLSDQLTIPGLRNLSYGPRKYKIIRISDEDGHVISLRDRMLSMAS